MPPAFGPCVPFDYVEASVTLNYWNRNRKSENSVQERAARRQLWRDRGDCDFRLLRRTQPPADAPCVRLVGLIHLSHMARADRRLSKVQLKEAYAAAEEIGLDQGAFVLQEMEG